MVDFYNYLKITILKLVGNSQNANYKVRRYDLVDMIPPYVFWLTLSKLKYQKFPKQMESYLNNPFATYIEK